MSIAVNVNGKDYYDKEEARAAWFEEWLMKQDFEQDLIDRENELEYRRTHPDWNIPYVMYGVRKKHKCIKKKELLCFMTLRRGRSVPVLPRHIGLQCYIKEEQLLKKWNLLETENIHVDILFIPCILRKK